MTFGQSKQVGENNGMSTIQIGTPSWQKMYKFLRAHPNVYAGRQEACRRSVEGVQWVLRSGAQWCELPEHYGHSNSVYKRFARWETQGIGAAMHAYFVEDPDMESVLLDNTVIRAHMCAAGGSKKTGCKPHKR